MKLAARLEAHTRTCGETVLIDGATQAALNGLPATKPLGELALRGKAAAVALARAA